MAASPPMASNTGSPDGAAWERAAQRELERAGLRLRAANVRYPFGELDLVMDHGDVLVFVEVRYRKGSRFGGGAASVDARKRARLVRAASAYLAATPVLARRACRFDVVSIGGEASAPRFDWIRNAFTLDESA
jgi:putative endonuclease